MARPKKHEVPTPIRQAGRKIVVLGDVREAAVIVREGGRSFKPVVALCVRADNGQIVGESLGQPGDMAATLMEAFHKAESSLREQEPRALIGEVVLFNADLAKRLKPMLALLKIDVRVAAPFEPLEDLFADLFANLQGPQSDLPAEALRPLLSAAEKLWRAKPWEYAWDEPPFALVPKNTNARPLYAAVLGHSKESFGVALYTSLDDYEETLTLGGAITDDDDVDPVMREIARRALSHRQFSVTFEPKYELSPAYREQLVRLGWPSRLGSLPTFFAIGGREEPGPLSPEEATEVVVTIESLVTFCQRHRQRLVDEDFPIRDQVNVSVATGTVCVAVSVPGEDPAAPPATVYRLKVSLRDYKDVWRTIDVLSDQTLEDLHYAIQDAFDWDDDHSYAFFMSGKAWDKSTIYVPSDTQAPGDHSAEARLRRLDLHPRKRFLYIFDFGDEWCHDIRVEKVGLPADEGEYPRVVESHGDAPPQYGGEDEDDEDDEGGD